MISRKPQPMSSEERLACIQRVFNEGVMTEKERDLLEYLNK